jgi:hypothetical protein
MFRLENDDAYVGLHAPISIDKSIQHVVIVRGFIVDATYLVTNVLNGGEDDGIENLEEYATTSSNDS